MARGEGYATWTDRETGKVVGEAKTLNCAHCQRLIVFHNAEGQSVDRGVQRSTAAAHDPGGRCPMCDAAICGPCCDELDRTMKCKPFEKRLEEMESGNRLMSALGA